MTFRIINGKVYSAPAFPQDTGNKPLDKRENLKGKSFKDIFSEKINEDFKISAHAMERMRRLNLTREDNLKLNEAFNKAEKKGCKDSVFIYKDTAFIASIENRTIITAVDKERAKENVFTNIDSVIIL
ncbi:TIGR02530 family flagellar biosynthesis protein [Clostridium hydrogeniformans]|uniref:TIGR02530 family flagellar biosynthesis protein n=1 Tax=Clostridium hydrogeniformans TaxID=349933 RepID=UPI000484C56F|nr:TIGR02530 family flagellar biosynthesis protein [Clostridium hydrogeniformans]